VKIQAETFSNGLWATDRLTANKGKYSLTLPNVQSGSYLLRSEVLALHEGQKDGGAQFYMACIQLRVASQGGTVSNILSKRFGTTC
jgi:cellulase